MRRQAEALVEGVFDLLVLGGGITGAGVALDAASRGLRTALIDKGDFACGTSSVSSKLVHGGLRYLEHGDFRLVYEALHERRRLLTNAPHLVAPLRFVLPFYDRARVRPWKWRLGLLLYDLLAGRGNLHRSRSLPLHRLSREFPGLQRAGLLGGAEYWDARMDDARLCLDVVHTAVEHGAVVANYVEAIAFERDGGLIRGVRAVDRLTGRELRIQARQVLNATGPWSDAVRRLAGDDDVPRLAPTKGVHLIAPDRGLDSAFLFLHPNDGRVFFVIPWMGKTLLGTTDTECDCSPDALTVTPEDVDYLLRGFNAFFDPPLEPREVLGSFVGLRPLLGSRPGEPSARTREFAVFAAPSGLLTVAGGKYTTYRHMAEVATDAVLRRLGLRRRCVTQTLRLSGAPRQPWPEFAAALSRTLAVRHDLGPEAAAHLVARYGSRAEDVAAYLYRDAGLARRIVPEEPDLLVELVYQREEEMAQTPADHFLRRLRVGMWRPDLLAHPPAV